MALMGYTGQCDAVGKLVVQQMIQTRKHTAIVHWPVLQTSVRSHFLVKQLQVRRQELGTVLPTLTLEPQLDISQMKRRNITVHLRTSPRCEMLQTLEHALTNKTKSQTLANEFASASSAMGSLSPPTRGAMVCSTDGLNLMENKPSLLLPCDTQ